MEQALKLRLSFLFVYCKFNLMTVLQGQNGRLRDCSPARNLRANRSLSFRLKINSKIPNLFPELVRDFFFNFSSIFNLYVSSKITILIVDKALKKGELKKLKTSFCEKITKFIE